MLIASLICAFILCFIASILNEENAPYMISGVNTMPKEKHKNIDFKGLVIHFKRCMYTLSGVLVLLGIADLFIADQRIGMAIFILLFCFGMVYFIFFGRKYDKNPVTIWHTVSYWFLLAFLIGGGFLLCYIILQLPIEELNN